MHSRANTWQTTRSRHINSHSNMSWLVQVWVITFICVGLASEGLACHTPTFTPTSLTFYAVQGAANPPSQTMTFSRTVTYSATLGVSDNATWLTLSPTSQSMTTSAKFTAAVNTSGRGAGTYKATITMKLGTWCTFTAPATLIISPATSSPPPTTSTSSATVTWNAVTGATVSGYKVYVGEAPRQYSRTINVGTSTSSTVNSLTRGRTYYFAVTAYNSAGEGSPSNEVSKTIP